MLEIIGMTVEDAKAIEYCGADRIELISALTEGGLTPSYSLIENVVKSVNIPVNVMIRPHANSFMYSDYDINIMLKDIEIAKELGANGVVLGLLNKDNEVDENNLKKLLSKCEGIDVTFHKAIDEIDVLKGIDVLNKYKEITTVLTSGGIGKIDCNIDIINKMSKLSKKAEILLGGGLNFDNIKSIKECTESNAYHFGTAVRVKKSPFEKIDENKLKDLVKIIK